MAIRLLSIFFTITNHFSYNSIRKRVVCSHAFIYFAIHLLTSSISSFLSTLSTSFTASIFIVSICLIPGPCWIPDLYLMHGFCLVCGLYLVRSFYLVISFGLVRGYWLELSLSLMYGLCHLSQLIDRQAEHLFSILVVV